MTQPASTPEYSSSSSSSSFSPEMMGEIMRDLVSPPSSPDADETNWKNDTSCGSYTQKFIFPPEPSMSKLIVFYFTRQEIYTPLLHRPTFERGVAEGLHWSIIAPQACSTLIGVALRLAQDIGLHVRKIPAQAPSVESEQYKRAFWILLFLDCVTSAEMGRTCALQYEDFDVDPLIEVDDEYWGHPLNLFHQPPGVPSRVEYFNAVMGLGHLRAFCVQNTKLFAANRGREGETVAELHSALDAWLARVPPHLRWDSSRSQEDDAFFDQSVAPPPPHSPCPDSDVSPVAGCAQSFVDICGDAARACADMVYVQSRRIGNVINLRAVFGSAHFLLLNLWNQRHRGTSSVARAIDDVHKRMQVLHKYQTRCRKAGMLWDILAEFAAVIRVQLPDAFPARVFTPRWTHEEPLSLCQITSGSDGSRWEHQSIKLPAPVGKFALPREVGGGAGVFSHTFRTVPAARITTHTPPFVPPPSYMQTYIDQNVENGNWDNQLDDCRGTSLWTSAPTGMEPDAWGTYLINFAQITQGWYKRER
ncbi:hypothetical protein K438DRAFT_1969362 [Mycena galopus ATCC 62051]|nr:hypothetical protein K438DRAFT_1969362 [Mycena galopus ATCC 62051]